MPSSRKILPTFRGVLTHWNGSVWDGGRGLLPSPETFHACSGHSVPGSPSGTESRWLMVGGWGCGG